MKKNLMTLAAVLCCAMMTSMFTSCTKDDNVDPTPADDTKPVAGIMNYSLTVGDDMVNYLDLTIEYYDAAGKVQSEQMTQKTWTKKVKAALPAKLGMRLNLKLKNGVDPSTIAKFTESYTYAFEVYPVNKSEKMLEGGKGGSSSITLSIGGDKLAEWAEDHAKGLTKCLYVIDAEGKLSSAKWE